MLDPLRAIDPSQPPRRSIRARSSSAIETTSWSARPSSGPGLSPCPRWSKAIVAKPGAKLKVEAANQNAVRLYERLGMQVVEQLDRS